MPVQSRIPSPRSFSTYKSPVRGNFQPVRSAGDLIEECLWDNKKWAARKVAIDPEYFSRWADHQTPEILFIGCSDSRVVPNDILCKQSGEIFVHRNVGNVVNLEDTNCMAVLEYGIGALKVKHVIVCGHYGCGAIKAALSVPPETIGFTNGWITQVKEIKDKWARAMSLIPKGRRADLLCELNTLEQTRNVCLCQAVQNAWKNGQELYVHALIYDISDGIIKKLATEIDSSLKVLTVDLAEEGCVIKAERLQGTLRKGLRLAFA
eukprot:g6695.t1